MTSATRFMLGHMGSTPETAIEVLDAIMRLASIGVVGRDNGLFETPSEARAVEGQREGNRVFSVTVEEVQ